MKWLSTKDQRDKEEYDKLKRKERKTINFSKNKTWDNKCKEVDTYIGERKCSMEIHKGSQIYRKGKRNYSDNI